MSKPKILGPEVGYIETLNYYTQEIINDRAAGPSKYNPLRPSSAGKCERELGYEFAEFRGYKQYEKVPNTPEVHRLLNFGNPVEKHVIWEMIDAFKRMPKPIQIKYQQQVLSFFELPDGSRVEGSIDLALISEKYGCIADVKSKKDKFSQFYKTSWDELGEKLAEMKSVHKFGDECYWVEDLVGFLKELDDPFFAMNFYQLNMYFYDENQFIRQRGIDHAAIFQYNKNDSRMREIRFKPCEQLYLDVKNKFITVQSSVDRDRGPDSLHRDYLLGSAKCGFCRFKSECWSEADALKEHFNTWPKKFWAKDLDRLAPAAQAKLKDAFKIYDTAIEAAGSKDKVEADIVKELNKLGVKKIKLDDGRVFEVKLLKSGGVGGSPRLVLRRTKQ